MNEISDSDDRFRQIFKKLTKKEFIEDPTRILSFMKDFGFNDRQVRLFRTAMVEDLTEVKEFIQSPMGSGYELIENIADYCLVSENALKDIMDGIRSSLYGYVQTMVVDDREYGMCKTSIDGNSIYSLYMTVLWKVKGNLRFFSILDSVIWIGEYAFEGCSSLKEVIIPDSVTEIGEGAFVGCASLETIHIPDSVMEIG